MLNKFKLIIGKEYNNNIQRTDKLGINIIPNII